MKKLTGRVKRFSKFGKTMVKSTVDHNYKESILCNGNIYIRVYIK